jgi:hypothetical protein
MKIRLSVSKSLIIFILHKNDATCIRMIFCIAKKLLRKAKSPFEDGWLCRVILVEQNSLTEQYFHIFVNRSNACDAEIGCQNILPMGDKNAGRVGPKWIFFTPSESNASNTSRFLFVPGDVVSYGQLIEIVESESIFQREGNAYQRIAVVALAGIEHARNPVDVSQRKLIIAIFCTSGRQDDCVFGKFFGKFGIVVLPDIRPSHLP